MRSEPSVPSTSTKLLTAGQDRCEPAVQLEPGDEFVSTSDDVDEGRTRFVAEPTP